MNMDFDKLIEMFRNEQPPNGDNGVGEITVNYVHDSIIDADFHEVTLKNHGVVFSFHSDTGRFSHMSTWKVNV